jgi:hypothetical protein
MHLRELKMVFDCRSEYFLQWLEGRAFLSVAIAHHYFRRMYGTTLVYRFSPLAFKASECP